LDHLKFKQKYVFNGREFSEEITKNTILKLIAREEKVATMRKGSHTA
jgi:hypothetical protein